MWILRKYLFLAWITAFNLLRAHRQCPGLNHGGRPCIPAKHAVGATH